MNIKNNTYKKINILFSTFICSLFLSCGTVFLDELEVPKNVKISSIASDSAVVSWSPVSKAKYYDVMWKLKESNDWTGSKLVEENQCQLEELLYNQEYDVKVAGMFEYKSGQYLMSDYTSNSFRTLPDVPPEGELGRPNNVKARFNEDKSAIIIIWDSVEGASYYDINLKEDKVIYYSPGLNILKTISAEKTELVYTGTIPKNKIIIKVAARDSDFSDTCRWSYEVYLD